MSLFLFLLMAAVFGWSVMSALQTGRVNSKVRKYSHPIMYWISIAFTTLLALACLAVGLGLLPSALLNKSFVPAILPPIR
jgi:hypothetical protein